MYALEQKILFLGSKCSIQFKKETKGREEKQEFCFCHLFSDGRWKVTLE